MATKSQRATKNAPRRVKRPTVGARIIEGLEQAIAWTRGQNERVRVTPVDVPEIDIRVVRRKMGVSQAQSRPSSAFHRDP